MSGHPDPEDLDPSVSEALLSGTDPSVAPDVASVLDALRSPAHGAEYAPAADLVPRLAQAARDARKSGALARGTGRMVVLGAAGAVLAGGAAAAATGALDSILPAPQHPVVVEMADPEDGPEASARVEEEDGEVFEPPAVPAPPGPHLIVEIPLDPPEWLTEEVHAICADPDANHGEYVSSVAHMDDEDLGDDVGNHGGAVSQVAQDEDCDGQADDKDSEDDGDHGEDGDHGDDGDDGSEDRDGDSDDESGQGHGPKPKKPKGDDG
ncbi:MAG: hypothetical protein GY698_23760 [Actinomycetia bacterium]|nr:hypothetical protein [Actinomycetes bacterium]